MELKQSAAFRVPVRLVLSASGAGKTGLAFGSVTVYLQKQAGASAQKALGAGDWFEIDAANFPGVYDLLLSAGDTDTLGFLKYSVAVTDCDRYYGLLEVVANLEADTYVRIGAPAGASIAADIAAQAGEVNELWGLMGLDAGTPLVVDGSNPAAMTRTSPGVNQTINTVAGVVTVQRT